MINLVALVHVIHLILFIHSFDVNVQSVIIMGNMIVSFCGCVGSIIFLAVCMSDMISMRLSWFRMQ